MNFFASLAKEDYMSKRFFSLFLAVVCSALVLTCTATPTGFPEGTNTNPSYQDGAPGNYRIIYTTAEATEMAPVVHAIFAEDAVMPNGWNDEVGFDTSSGNGNISILCENLPSDSVVFLKVEPTELKKLSLAYNLPMDKEMVKAEDTAATAVGKYFYSVTIKWNEDKTTVVPVNFFLNPQGYFGGATCYFLMPRRDVAISDIVLSVIETVNEPTRINLGGYIGLPYADTAPILGGSSNFYVNKNTSATVWSYAGQPAGENALRNGNFRVGYTYTVRATLVAPGIVVPGIVDTINTAYVFPTYPKICVFVYEYTPKDAPTVYCTVKQTTITNSGKGAKVTIVFPKTGSNTIGTDVD
jgi:hypothetical protein